MDEFLLFNRNKIILFFQYFRQNVMYHIKPFPCPSLTLFKKNFVISPLIWSSIKISSLCDNPSHCFINFRSPQTFISFSFVFLLSSFIFYHSSSNPNPIWYGLNIVHNEHLFVKLNIISIDKCEYKWQNIKTITFEVSYSNDQISPLFWCSVHAISEY